MNLLYIGIGGFLGSCARFLLSSQVYRIANSFFQFGTMAVNLIGSFLIGFFFEMFDNILLRTEIKNFITIGFLGGFTTFSSFAIENINLLKDGEIKFFLMNILVSNILGLVFVLAGIFTAKFVFKILK